jgi:hypothetical protein
VGFIEFTYIVEGIMATYNKKLCKTFYNPLQLVGHLVIDYVKDEGGNLSIFARFLFLVITCEPLALEMPCQITYFGHAFKLTICL